MLKRIFAVMIVLACLVGTASAESTMYVNNPSPADRLHLRRYPDQNSESLGKYYNGTDVTVLRSQGNWSEVRVGEGDAHRTGWMMTKYLSLSKPEDAMPQYVAITKTTGYYQPVMNNSTMTIDMGRMLSFMGFIEKPTGDWYHVLVHTGSSEGPYYAFLPEENGLQIQALASGHGVNVHISNPDKNDRLHLRTEPSAESKSLGKYYNGCIGTMIGFSGDGEWIQLELYGRTGWMKSDFLTIEGQRNSTRYGIPTIYTTAENAPVYSLPELDKVNYKITLPRGTVLEVLGLIGEDTLHVREENGDTCFIHTSDTNFTNSKKQYFNTDR